MKMKKILLITYLFYSLNISADLLQEGIVASEKGNLEYAKKSWTKACENGVMKACDKLGEMYYFGYGVQQYQIKAKELYKKVCDAGNGEDCTKIARMYDNGYTVKEDKSKAMQFYKKACDDGFEEGCKNYFNLKRKE